MEKPDQWQGGRCSKCNYWIEHKDLLTSSGGHRFEAEVYRGKTCSGPVEPAQTIPWTPDDLEKPDES